MPDVRVMMMQKNEGDMLVRWLGHYSGLFGHKNLSILDNGSSDAYTSQILHEAESHGSRIYWGLDSPNDFLSKGLHFTNIITQLDGSDRYDFALPVDCDEILSVFTDGGLCSDHAAILAEIDRLRGETASLRLDMSMFNVPDRPGWFAPDRHFVKGFLPANAIGTLDNGHHVPTSRLRPGYVTTRLTYLHYHNRPYGSAVLHARDKLRNRVDVDDPQALEAYGKRADAPGQHLVRMLFLSQSEYAGRYDREVQVFVPPSGTSNLVKAEPGVRIWDAEAYLHRHPDVRQYELTPLHHYLMHGFVERRDMR